MEENRLSQTRDEVIESLRRDPRTTFCVVGGGVHGAAFARLAARNGIACVLLERSDYAAETSSRSSKMAHGGLRYLEMLDLVQVSEGIRARDDLFRTARHLCRPSRFLIPVPRGEWWFRLKLGVGMTLYDLMGTDRSHRSRFHPRTELAETGFQGSSMELDGCYEYVDGLLQDDSRLVLESILDARQYGARCINHFEVVAVEKHLRNYSVVCRDRFGRGEVEIVADLVINCAGPWVPWINSSRETALASQVRYSAGTHLLFDRPWNGPSLFLPISENGVRKYGRYYFVWPHPGGGTMVGTTEREVAERPGFDPMPTPGEVEEILRRLKEDLPAAGLNRETLYYGFSGVRTLPLRSSTSGTAGLSRKHRWNWTETGLALLGGKLTTANWTVWEGFRMAVERLDIRGTWKSLYGIGYPGSATDAQLHELCDALAHRDIPLPHAERLVSRLGLRARFLLSKPEFTQPLARHLVLGEVELALQEEQCLTLEDLLRRRTGVEYLPHGLEEAIEATMPLLMRFRDAKSLEAEACAYRQRLEGLRVLLKDRPLYQTVVPVQGK